MIPHPGTERRLGRPRDALDSEGAPPSVPARSRVKPPPPASVPDAPRTREPRLLDRVRELSRARHLSRRTEQAYVGWIRRYILFHGNKRHPSEFGWPRSRRS